MNPTQDLLEQRVAALEGGIAALAVASGQAAVTYSVLTIAEAGDNIVSSSALYGGTYNLFAHTLPQYGITTRFADHRDPTSFEPLIDAQTQRLPNGNTHITESATSWRFEITPDGEVVWEFVLPWFAAYPDKAARSTGGGALNSVFQAFRYTAERLPWLARG